MLCTKIPLHNNNSTAATNFFSREMNQSLINSEASNKSKANTGKYNFNGQPINSFQNFFKILYYGSNLDSNVQNTAMDAAISQDCIFDDITKANSSYPLHSKHANELTFTSMDVQNPVLDTAEIRPSPYLADAQKHMELKYTTTILDNTLSSTLHQVQASAAMLTESSPRVSFKRAYSVEYESSKKYKIDTTGFGPNDTDNIRLAVYKALETLKNFGKWNEVKLFSAMEIYCHDCDFKTRISALSHYLHVYRRGITTSNAKLGRFRKSLTELLGRVEQKNGKYINIATEKDMTVCFNLAIISIYYYFSNLDALLRYIDIPVDENSDSAASVKDRYLGLNIIESPGNTVESFMKIIRYVGSLLREDPFKTNIIKNADQLIINVKHSKMFITNYMAITSHYFTDPFFEMLNNIMSLEHEDNGIHRKYVSDIFGLLNRIEKWICDVLKTISVGDGIYATSELKFNDQSIFRYKHCIEDDFLDITNSILLIESNWCVDLNRSDSSSINIKQFLVINFLTTLLNLFKGINFLFRCTNKNFDGIWNYRKILGGNIFENLIFNSFDPNKMMLFADLFLRGFHDAADENQKMYPR